MKRLAYAVSLIVVGLMLVYLARQQDLLANLRSVSATALAVLLAISVLITAAGGAQFRQATSVFGLHLSIGQAYGLTTTNMMLNYAVPLKGGFIMRAAYMKSRYGLSYTDYAALLASSQVVTMASAGAAGLAALLLARTLHDIASVEITLVLSLVVIGGLLAMWLIEAIDFNRLRPERLGRRIQDFSIGFGHWRRHPRAAVRFAGTVILGITLQGLRLFLIFRALGTPVPFAPTVAIASVVAIFGALGITPGNLGIKEGATALTASLLGLDARVALLASLIDRAVALVVVFGLGLATSQTLLRGWLRERRVVDDEGPHREPR